jgi:hypothetical protein
MSNPSGLALEGGDPRDAGHPVLHSSEAVENQLMHASHDPGVSFEEYIYYAKITRAEEKAANERYVEAAGPKTIKSVLLNRFSKGQDINHTDSAAEHSSTGEKEGLDEKAVTPRNLGRVSDSEWKTASRATRTAGWSGVFYLITTDILGPYSVPYVSDPSLPSTCTNDLQGGLLPRWAMGQELLSTQSLVDWPCSRFTLCLQHIL